MFAEFFDETLPKGQEHDFIYRLRLHDGTNLARPFLGHTVDSPVEELVLRVNLMPSQEVKMYKRQFFISAASNLALWEEEVLVDNPQNRQLEWVIPDAKHHFYYRLSW